MNKRLVWNFEINPEPPLPVLPASKKHLPLRREARYFWDENTPVTLHGLGENVLNLAAFKIKERMDIYYLLPNHDYNIKKRRDETVYKPLLEKNKNYESFDKKIDLSEFSGALPGTEDILSAQDLLQLIKTQSRSVPVEKTTLVYKFLKETSLRLELARLRACGQIFFSACIEGTDEQQVKTLSQHLLPGHRHCGYIHFLKQMVDWNG